MSEFTSTETAVRLAELTAIAQTRALTREEAKEAVALTRADRISASYASKGAKAAKKPASSVEDVLKKMEAFMQGKEQQK